MQLGTEQLTKLGTLAFQAIPIFAIWSVPGWWWLVEKQRLYQLPPAGVRPKKFCGQLACPCTFLL